MTSLSHRLSALFAAAAVSALMLMASVGPGTATGALIA